MIPSSVIGTYTGNGLAKNIVIGFMPDFLIVTNVTDGTVVAFWYRGLHAAGTATDIVLAAAPNPDNAITAYNDPVNGAGFTVGTDYSVNAKVYGYAAFRSGPGAT